MRRNIITNGALTALLASMALNASAGVVYENDFGTNILTTSSDFLALDANGGNKWTYNAYGTKFVYISCLYQAYAHTANNDYLVTPPMELKAGHAYTLVLAARGQNLHSKETCADTEPGFDYSLKVLVGKTSLPKGTAVTTANQADLLAEVSAYPMAADIKSIPVTLDSGGWIDNAVYANQTVQFTVPEDGTYRLAFHAYSAGVAIDKMTLTDNGTDSTPLGLTAESVAFTPTTGLSRTQNFAVTLPTQAMTGAQLSALSALKVKRNDQVVATVTEGVAPGAVISVSDTPDEPGLYTYSFIVVNGAEESEALTLPAMYVGPDAPAAPANLHFVRRPGINQVSWDAVVVGAHGKALDEGQVKYRVVRCVDGVDTLIGVQTATSYEEAYASEGLQNVCYKVTPLYYDTVEGATGVSETVGIGSMSLPMEETFGTGALPAAWSVTSNKTGSAAKYWTAQASSSSIPDADGSKGYAYFNSYNFSRGVESSLITPNLNLNSVANPVLEFAFYHTATSSGNKDRLVVEISKDGGAFEQLPGMDLLRYRAVAGWETVEVPLLAYKDAESVRIAFRAISDYGQNMYLDAVKIYSVASKDLAATSIEGPESVMAGKEAPFTLTVRNNAALEATGYAVNVYCNDELAATVEGPALAAKSTVAIPFAVPCDLRHLSAFNVRAEVVFDGDENVSDNVSATLAPAVTTLTAPKVQNVIGEVAGDQLMLAWDAPEVAGGTPVNSTLNFDTLPYTLDEYKLDKSVCYFNSITDASGNVWTNLDADRAESASLYSLPAGAFGYMTVSSGVTGSSYLVDHAYTQDINSSSGMLVAVAPKSGNGAASDWLISPRLSEGVNSLSFYAKSVSSYYKADFVVEYCTSESYSTLNPAADFVNLAAPVSLPASNVGATWTLYEYTLPADAKYVAIRFISEYSAATNALLCLDDINLVSEPFSAPTYNVYMASESGAAERVNEALVSTESYSLPAPRENRTFYVSTVYPQGETSWSAPFMHDASNVNTGVETLRTSQISVCGRTVNSALPVSIYTLDGRQVATSVSRHTLPAAGIYLLRSHSGATMRVIVK